ncbi:PH domain-containing protein [Roseivirga sp.]|uniref:PH domain-containing protein n=1 Tax=Roseivirga sp. TaxID=1964215 RepID=UPI002B26DA89|nr:PH domain-containing protein [Roseivirga sp.]
MEQTNHDFSIPQRQPSVAIGIILIKFFRMTIKAIWPILVSLIIGRRAGSTFNDIILYVVIGFAAYNLIGSILTYFRFYYYVKDNAIVLDKGVLRKTRTNIPFERIQTINFSQNLLHRLFNVVSVEIDSAGANKSEISIDALSKDEAIALREYIMAEKEHLISESGTEEEKEISADRSPSELLLHLTPSDLLKVGVSQNHLRSMGIIFAFVFTTMNELTNDIGDFVSDQFTQFESFAEHNTLFAFVASAILVTIISFLFSLGNSLLKYYDLKLWMSKNGLKLVRGLLNREEVTINRNKVQMVSWSTNPIRKLFKMYTLQIAQASSSEVNAHKSKINVPGSYKEQLAKVINMVFPSEYLGTEVKHSISPVIKFRIVLFYGILPSLVALSAWFLIEDAAFYFLLVLPLSFFLGQTYHKKRSYEINEELIRSNGGIVGTENVLTQIHKIQAVKVKQSWYQRRKRLATIKLYTAAGEMSIPYITISEALQLENFVLYRVQTDKREWM